MSEEISLQKLSEQITQTQAEVDALEAQFSRIEIQTDDNTDDIVILKDPPAGVPPGLSKWYGDGHTTTEVDPPLAGRLTSIDDTVTSHDSAITGIYGDLSTEANDRMTADSSIQGNVDSVQSQVTDNLDMLNADIVNLGLLSSSVAEGYDTINVRIDGVADNLAAETSARQTATNSLNSQVASLSSAAQMHNTQIQLMSGIGVPPEGAQAAAITELTVIANDSAAATETESTVRANADTALENSINAISGQISTNTSQIAAETSARQSADAAHDAAINTINTELDGHTADMSGETGARIAADEALQSDIDSQTSGIAANASAIAAETTARTDADNAMQTDIGANTSQIGYNTAAITALEEQIEPLDDKYGLLIDGLGYVTGYQDLGGVQPPSLFMLHDLNHNMRIHNFSWPNNYLPQVAVVSFKAPDTFDADWGGATSNIFSSLDTLNHTRQVKVYSAGSLVALNGSTFLGPAYGSGGSLQRLAATPTLFKVRVSGAVEQYLSLWYRIKSAPTDTNQAWVPVAWSRNLYGIPYGMVVAEAAVQIAMPLNDTVIEFGFTILNPQDATIGGTNDQILGGVASVEAFNMTQIA